MIDIHSHIVFDVDDGPKTREDTRALLEESYRQGYGPLSPLLIVARECLKLPKKRFLKIFKK